MKNLRRGSHWQDSPSIPHEGSGIASPVGS
jgi:hypothetical protein